jgi:hypothetical protein
MRNRGKPGALEAEKQKAKCMGNCVREEIKAVGESPES